MTTTARETDKLLPLDEVRQVLAHSEPLGEVAFTIGDQVRFDVANGWEFGLAAKELSDTVDAWVTIGGGRGKRELRLTKEALFQVSSYAGMPHRYTEKLPAPLLTPSLNYWFREGLRIRSGSRTKDFKILTSGSTGVAITRQSLHPFSNLELLDQTLAAIEDVYGETEIRVDPKLFHSLFQTYVRLVLPEHGAVVTGSGVDDDRWALGVEIKNSLNGRGKTSVNGYLYRFATGAGLIDIRNPAGGTWVRKQNMPNDDVYDWARDCVARLFAGLPATLDAVQATTEVALKGHVSQTLADVFEHYRVRVSDRSKIINRLAQAERMTMYEVLNAVTSTADEPGLEHQYVEALLRLGGDLPYASTSLCDACRRLGHQH